MSSKVLAGNKGLTVKSKRDSSDSSSKRAAQPAVCKQVAFQRPTASSPDGVLVFDNCSTTVEVTVKTKGRKRTSTMVSGSPTNQKAIEEKKRPGSSGGDSVNFNWSRTLREQNRVAMKQSLQHYAARTHSSKSTRQSSTDSKEARKSLEVHRSQKYELGLSSKHLDEIPVKQVPSRGKSDEQIKMAPTSIIPSTTSLASSMESIVVVDRAVQCGGIFDCSADRFGVFNPVRTLGFLMKELEGLVRDERSSKILLDMEQALFRIPMEPGKPTPADLEEIALRTKLEAYTAKLEATSKKMEATCETLRDQRDSLQQQVQKQATLLEEARQREVDQEVMIKKLQVKLDETTRSAIATQKNTLELQEDNKRIDMLQKMTINLRAELNEQIELAQQRFMEGQYLKLEKEKLMVLSSYKDTQLVELRAAVKELQQHITEQLMGLREVYKRAEDSPNHHQISVIHGGLACSSPTPTSSDHSNIPPSWRGLSDISLSTVEPNTYYGTPPKKSSPNKGKNISFVGGMAGDAERRSKEVKTQLEFISLPGGETSQSMSLSAYKEDDSKRPSHTGIGDEGPVTRDKKDSNLRDIVAAIAEIEKPDYEADLEPQSQHQDKVRDGLKSLYRAKRSSESDKIYRAAKDQPTNRSIVEDNPKVPKAHSTGNPIDVSIKEQFQNIFKDIRQQSRMPVHIPSPPRHYPHPDWSDSSLPSISGISESNII